VPDQFGKGAREDNTVAAHCLAGRLLVSARPIDTLAEWLSEEHPFGSTVQRVVAASALEGQVNVVTTMELAMLPWISIVELANLCVKS
jgi:hypothetical protein